MIQIASDHVNRPLYRAIVKTLADINASLSKHSLSIFLIGSKGLFIWSRASPGPQLSWPALPRSRLHKKFHSITYNVLFCVYIRVGPARLGEIPPLLTRDLG